MAGKKKKTAKRSPSKRKTPSKPVDVSAVMENAKEESAAHAIKMEEAIETRRGELNAKDIPSGGGLMGLPMLIKENADLLEVHHKSIEQVALATEEVAQFADSLETKVGKLETELAELKVKMEKMEKLFYLPGSVDDAPEGGANAV